MAPVNSSLVCSPPITAKPVPKIRSCCLILLPQAIAALPPTLAEAVRNWNTHRKKSPAKATKATSTGNSARKVSAGSGFSCWYSSYRLSLQEESGIGSGQIGMANLDVSGLAIPAVRLTRISHGSHGQSRRSVLWLLLSLRYRF